MNQDPNSQKSTTPPDPQVAPAPGQKVQYVVTQKSLSGVGGWLLFFVFVFAILGLAELSLFFTTLSDGVKDAVGTMDVVFAPLLAAGFLTSVVLITMRKKIAVLAAYVTLAVTALYSTMSQLVSTEEGGVAMKIGGVVVALVFYALLALYFYQSRRVKETLVK